MNFLGCVHQKCSLGVDNFYDEMLRTPPFLLVYNSFHLMKVCAIQLHLNLVVLGLDVN